MRGLLSFLLVMLLAETLLTAYSLYTAQARSSDYAVEQSLHLQDFYFKKMQAKREMQNIVAQGCTTKDPYNCIEEIAGRLANYEAAVEPLSGNSVDIWCGYLSVPSHEMLLLTLQSGATAPKPPGIFDARDKIKIMTPRGEIEVHACSSVLVYDYDENLVSIGRGQMPEGISGGQAVIPVLGVSIADRTNGIYDVDYVGVV
ncbi:MAG: hypothetical protein N3H30_00140 [Candidatus Micrarchaeota archaeon]|nr:hypothetical protein [Candidatus Micrarchaeota archaeon]